MRRGPNHFPQEVGGEGTRPLCPLSHNGHPRGAAGRPRAPSKAGSGQSGVVTMETVIRVPPRHHPRPGPPAGGGGRTATTPTHISSRNIAQILWRTWEDR